MEDWVTIRTIKTKNPDIGSRAIAKMLGISRNTVKKALSSDEMPLYNRGEKKVNEHIIPHVGFIKDSFLKKHLKASRILKDIRSRGYAGSQYALYAYIREWLKPIADDVSNTSPDAYMRYETAPGEQMQYDWSEYQVEIGATMVKVYVHLCILGYSRYKCYDVSLSITQSDVFGALEESFSFFGGVCERIQVDNATVFVTNASKEHLVWNQRFLHFCGFYGIKPTRSLPAHPWSKGKVENPFAYLETHFIAGNTFVDFNALRQRLKGFENEHNLLLHGTTKQITKVLFEQEEQSRLLALPHESRSGEIKRYIGFKEEFRKVTSDCLISYRANRYSVPHLFANKEIWLRIVHGTTLQIYSSQNKLIASHALCLDKGEVIINSEHFKGYRTQGYDTLSLSVSRLTKRFVHYSNIHRFIESVQVQKRINPARHLYKIANLFEYYDDRECVIAMEECFTLNTYSFAIVKGTLSVQSRPKKEQLNLFNITLPTGSITRDLGEYRL